jgi:hypothetical protein
MKVAVCISGQPRNVQATYPHIYENLIEPNNADVFIHSWIDPNFIGRRPVSSGGVIASDVIPSNIDQIILDLYQPKAYVFEPHVEFDGSKFEERKYPQIKPKNSISQRYSVFRSIALAMTHDNYDCIVRIRFDWAIGVPIEVMDFDLSRLICPGDCPHPNGINDQFGFGNTDVMMCYGGLYYNLDNLYDAGLPFCDEILLYHHMISNGFEISPINIPYQIVRGPDAHLRIAEDVI